MALSYLLNAIVYPAFITLWVMMILAMLSSFYFLYEGTYRTEMSLFYVSYYTYRFFVPIRRWQAFQDFQQKYTKSYFRSKKVVFEDTSILEKNNKMMIAYGPHGIFTSGWGMNLGLDQDIVEADFRFLTAWALTKIPLIAEYMGWLNARSADKLSLLRIMKRGGNFSVIPGGFEEASIFQYQKHKLFLKERQGFIKYGLQFGYHVAPAYCFGEEQLFYTVDGMYQVRMFLNKMKIPAVIFFSQLGIIPKRDVDMTTVVGKPIKLPHIAKPSKKDVDKYHSLFVQEMIDLFERHKLAYALDPKSELQIC